MSEKDKEFRKTGKHPALDNWQDFGYCNHMSLGLMKAFFGSATTRKVNKYDRRMRKIGREMCSICPVWAPCLANAVIHPHKNGNDQWAGLNLGERQIVARMLIDNGIPIKDKTIPEKERMMRIVMYIREHPEIRELAILTEREKWKKYKAHSKPSDGEQPTLFDDNTLNTTLLPSDKGEEKSSGLEDAPVISIWHHGMPEEEPYIIQNEKDNTND